MTTTLFNPLNNLMYSYVYIDIVVGLFDLYVSNYQSIKQLIDSN